MDYKFKHVKSFEDFLAESSVLDIKKIVKMLDKSKDGLFALVNGRYYHISKDELKDKREILKNKSIFGSDDDGEVKEISPGMIDNIYENEEALNESAKDWMASFVPTREIKKGSRTDKGKYTPVTFKQLYTKAKNVGGDVDEIADIIFDELYKGMLTAAKKLDKKGIDFDALGFKEILFK